jgi:hypothetical protein
LFRGLSPRTPRRSKKADMTIATGREHIGGRLMGGERGRTKWIAGAIILFRLRMHSLEQKRLRVYFSAEKCMSKRILLDMYSDVCYNIFILLFFTIIVIHFLWFFAFDFRLQVI